MDAILFFIFTAAILFIGGYIYRWRNPKCSAGILPPGSSGFPFIGEALQLIRPAPSLDLLPFIKNRISRYGPIFRTNIAGRNAVVSADPEFNRYLLRRDGELMEAWQMDTFAQTVMDHSDPHFLEKYGRKFVLHHFGVELIKQKLLSQVEQTAHQTLSKWSAQESVEVKGESITMIMAMAVQQFFSGDLEIAPYELSEMFKDFTQGLMSFPLNIPGTMHHKCLQTQKKLKRLIKEAVQRRLAIGGEKVDGGDLLDQLIPDIGTQEHFDEDFVVQLFFTLLFVNAESISTALSTSLKQLHDHPAVVEELAGEHEAILKRREKMDSPMSWSEYKSMTFTNQVINEVLRLENTSPGLLRRATKNIPANGYVIPKGWTIIIANSALHLDSNQFEDPLSFNPWRWKSIEPEVVSKCFLPFGSGIRQCTGSEYGKAFLAIILHVMVTKYRFILVKDAKILRDPILRFPDGVHISVSEKRN